MQDSTPECESLYAVFMQHFTLYVPPETGSILYNLGKIAVYNLLYAANLVASQTDHPFTPFSDIIPGRLFLGMQTSRMTTHPFFTDHERPRHHVDYRALNVAVIENQELTGSFVGGRGMAECYWPKEIEARGVRHYWLSIPDFSVEAHNELYIDAIYVMYAYYQKGLPIYVHCKSGKGRSSTLELIFLAYLLFKRDPVLTDILLNHDDDYYRCLTLFAKMQMPDGEQRDHEVMAILEQLESFLRSRRPIVSVPEKKRRKVLAVIKVLFESVQAKTDQIEYRSDEHKLVHEFAQSSVYKRIAMYVSDPTRCHLKAAKTLQDFFQRMIENRKGWYAELSVAVSGCGDRNDHLESCFEILPKTQYGECGDVRRLGYLEHLKETVDELLNKYPHSAYAKANVGHFPAIGDDVDRKALFETI